MQKRHKDLMRTLVIELRHILVGTTAQDSTVIRGDLDRELERLGIAPDGTITPLDAVTNPAPHERKAHQVAVAQLVYCDNSQRASMRMEIVERAAYSWINRLLALRAMETRGLIEETLRTNPEYDGLPEALFILRQSDPGRTSGADGGHCAVLEDACEAQANSLPGLFALDDPVTALRPSTPALIRCITLVGGSMPGFTLVESDAAFADPDAIGWAYQFYQEEAKARIYTKLGSGGKVSTRAEIAATTELFTEPYMVKWLLQNSLGRSYHEIYPDSTLPTTWEYYIKPDKLDTSTTFNLASLTVLDPCMGSGHFLREAFDMFVAIYREQFHTLSATEIADSILSHHLYGIDLDPRAAQLSALTLYLRAWELVRDERQKDRKPDPGAYTPPAMNLATTPTSLNEGALQRHLFRHPQDMPLKPLLEGIFSGLEQADILGSLIRPKEYLDNAISELQRPHTIRMDFNPEEAEVRRTITELANRDPQGLRKMLLDRVADSFKAEAGNTDDVSAALFGREAEQGVRLLQLLDRRYAVVVTNPPYMGSKNLDTPLKKYVEKYHSMGKRDLYATFILRCIELCRPHGRIAMVTMQSWMFLRSFAELRAIPEEQLPEAQKKGIFTGLLRETSIESLAHLGPNAFEEISGEVVQSAMIALSNWKPSSEHRMVAFRLVGVKNAWEKANALVSSNTPNYQTISYQKNYLVISNTPILYWLGSDIIKLLTEGVQLGQVVDIRQGMATANNERFLHQIWEIPSNALNRWPLYAKGGGYQKWIGFEELCFDYRSDGSYFRAYESEKFAGTQWNGILGRKFSLVERYMHRPSIVYTQMARGSMGPRFWPGGLFDVKSISIHHENPQVLAIIAAVLSSRYASYILRSITQNLEFHAGYTAKLPLLGNIVNHEDLASLANAAKIFKSSIISLHLTERIFNQDVNPVSYPYELVSGLLCSIEGCIEILANQYLELTDNSLNEIYREIGISSGLYPLLDEFDTLPKPPANLGLPTLLSQVQKYLSRRQRIRFDDAELSRVKANLRALYEAGPGARIVEQEEADETTEDSEDAGEIVSGAHIPIPTETFLEELSVKMQLHPISIYWLLEELKADGVRCKPEELRRLEDRLSILILRLVGHRWPKQLEAGEPVSAWTSSDGIIPLVAGTGEATLVEQVRARLRAEDGELGVQQTEALLTELTGLSLEEWLRRKFFSRHVSQFKYRPIAWHLASTPTNNGKKKRGWSQRSPAFECLLYYHACSGDALARIRTQYVEPLLRTEHQKMDEASLFQDEMTSMLANERLQELKAFVEKLRFTEEQGFACPELDTFIAVEPLDRWSGDGYLAPTSRDELLRNEQAWHVDINDGVRVNIAPLQLVGVLASDVLKTADAKKAMADRARWRADERRWVRDGKLPRCGWMDEEVPESSRWIGREPERIAEQIKLEQKRQALQSRRAEEVEI